MQTSKYLLASHRDVQWGLTVTTIGYEEIGPQDEYPTRGHADGYYFDLSKGRTRAERAGEKYYQGIRETPYAPFVKLADRLANITYSCSKSSEYNEHMRTIYRLELPHFLESLSKVSDDPRLSLPDVMVDTILDLVIEKPGNLRVMKK